MKNRKKVAFILIFGVISFLIINYRLEILKGISEWYNVINSIMGNVWLNVVLICAGACTCMIVCTGIGKSIDRKNHVKGNFSELHPGLNIINGLAMVAAIGALACALIYHVIFFIGHKISELIVWISDVASKMEAVVMVAFITGAVSIIGVIISSVIAKIIDYKKSRQEYLAQKREIPYSEFIEMVYKLQQNIKHSGTYTEAMMLEDLSKFSKQITLWGSSDVVNKWVEFRESGTDPNAGIDRLLLLEKIMNAMRKDLGLKKVKKGNLLAFFVNDIKKTLKASKSR